MAAIRRLPERERDLIALKYGADLTNREIARQLRLSESKPTTSELVPTAELPTRYPDLALLNVPARYALVAVAEALGDGRLVLTWADAAAI